jgi:hypothetical protein
MRRLGLLAASFFSLVSVASAQVDAWAPFVEADVVEIVTTDADDDPRETKVWIVTLDSHGYVRTNDSRWLANIRRGSAVAIRHDDHELRVVAEEVDDPAVTDRVEVAFKEKYGTMQRIMSFFRVSEPTTLRLTADESPITRAGPS